MSMSTSVRNMLFDILSQQFEDDETVQIVGNWFEFSEVDVQSASVEDILAEGKIVLMAAQEEFT